MSGTLSLQDVSVRFNGSRVLDAVSLDVAEGEWLGLIGPNGAGKTTLLRAISGVIGFKGTVATPEGEVKGLGRRALARIVALVPQNPVLPPGMRVVDYVLLGRTPHSSILAGPASRDLDAVASVLDSLSLAEFADREVMTLSGGELQRVVIARALAQESSILLLDEPTTALDVGKQQDVLELVDRLRRKRALTVVSAMHDLTIAGQFPDRLVMLSGGSIVAEGGAREVLDPDLIRTHYGAEVRVLDDGSGGIVVVPVRSN
ncbi:MAG: ABC transporter ATP-binding protein [Actinomycetota bacterium]